MEEVNHPSHYTSHPANVECIQITEHMNFCLGNAVKYLWRAGLKTDDPIKDLKKAVWYLEREIARIEKQQTAPFFSEANGWTKGGGWDIPDSSAALDPQPVGGWIPWRGGQNPAPGKRVKIRYSSMDEEVEGKFRSEDCHWGPEDTTITAYRVVR